MFVTHVLVGAFVFKLFLLLILFRSVKKIRSLMFQVYKAFKNNMAFYKIPGDTFPPSEKIMCPLTTPKMMVWYFKLVFCLLKYTWELT